MAFSATFRPFWPFWPIQGALAYSLARTVRDGQEWPEWSFLDIWHPRIRAGIEKWPLFDVKLRKCSLVLKTNGEILTFWPFRPLSQMESDTAVNSPNSDRKGRKTCRRSDRAGRKEALRSLLAELVRFRRPQPTSRVKGGDSFLFSEKSPFW